jgi:hypothetical protein
MEAVIAALAAHREARQWNDEVVAADLIAQLGLKPDGEAKNAKPAMAPGITEDEVLAHEAAAKEATDKAKAARDALNAQKTEGDDKAKSDADQAKAADAKRDADAKAVAAVKPAEAAKPATPAGPMTSAQLEKPGKG